MLVHSGITAVKLKEVHCKQNITVKSINNRKNLGVILLDYLPLRIGI
jgi:hypothetical protein